MKLTSAQSASVFRAILVQPLHFTMVLVVASCGGERWETNYILLSHNMCIFAVVPSYHKREAFKTTSNDLIWLTTQLKPNTFDPFCTVALFFSFIQFILLLFNPVVGALPFCKRKKLCKWILFSYYFVLFDTGCRYNPNINRYFDD